nr:hypothetical protein RVX_1733 [Nitratidesulfovibrio sp. HK-II]
MTGSRLGIGFKVAPLLTPFAYRLTLATGEGDRLYTFLPPPNARRQRAARGSV